MGNSCSVEQKIQKCAKDGDAVSLQALIQQIQRQGERLPKYLECPDADCRTPLIAAAAKGNRACVEILLRNNANVHTVRRPEGTTALHEAVQYCNDTQVSEMLMQYGANPFVEDARGLTAVDMAINRGHTSLLRSLELRSQFTGTLQMKIPKYLGLSAEWKSRWVVVMPRYQLASRTAPAAERVARSLLVCYRAPDQCMPVCRVWLDGAIARSVVSSRSSGNPQCALSLHRNHASPSGAFVTGDQTMGFTMHLRPADSSPQGRQMLAALMNIVNGTRPGPSQPNRPAGNGQSPQAALPAPPVRPASHQPSESDEDIARKLQQKYDAEMAEYVRRHPEAAAEARSKMSGSSGRARPEATAGTQHSPASSTSSPSAPMYPTINLAQPQTAGVTQTGIPHAGSIEWCAANLRTAPSPPPSAALPQVAAAASEQPGTGASSPAATPPPSGGDDDAGLCVVCLESPATSGFVHGDSVHKCCCQQCAQDLKRANVWTCPMCRERIDHVVLNFY